MPGTLSGAGFPGCWEEVSRARSGAVCLWGQDLQEDLQAAPVTVSAPAQPGSRVWGSWGWAAFIVRSGALLSHRAGVSLSIPGRQFQLLGEVGLPPGYPPALYSSLEPEWSVHSGRLVLCLGSWAGSLL